MPNSVPAGMFPRFRFCLRGTCTGTLQGPSSRIRVNRRRRLRSALLVLVGEREREPGLVEAPPGADLDSIARALSTKNKFPTYRCRECMQAPGCPIRLYQVRRCATFVDPPVHLPLRRRSCRHPSRPLIHHSSLLQFVCSCGSIGAFLDRLFVCTYASTIRPE